MTPDPDPQLIAALAPRYEVQRELGRGGMATVYLARDVRHDRLVAVKVLDRELAASVGADRFLAEIRLTAQLHHANILALFDSGEANGLLYYVMPYIAGETLRARLERERQLPVADAVRIATAVAHALEHAHKAGVVHRDLKPENILMQDGEPVVADFGIALAVRRAVGERLTMTGMSLGTPAYMSPEQATGDRVIDARADIFSLGCVTYEMLAGETPFAAATAQGTIARIVTDQPRPIASVRPSVPAHVAAAVARSLEKLPADRWTTAHDFAAALERPSVAIKGSPKGGGDSNGRTQAAWLPWAVAAVGAIVALTAIVFPRRSSNESSAADAPTIRFPLAAPDSQRSMATAVAGIPFAFSADDRHIAWIGPGTGGANRVYVRTLGELSPRPIIGSDGAATQPSLSRDGKWVAFVLDEKIVKTPFDGGPITTVLPVPNVPLAGMDWFAPDTMVASIGDALMLVPTSGGTPTRLVAPDTSKREIAFWGPHVAANGMILFITVSREGISGNRVAVYDRKSKRAIVSQHHGTTVVGAIDNHVIWVTVNGVVMSALLGTDGTLGEARALFDGVLVRAGGAAKAALGGNSLMYERGAALGRLAVVTPDGHATLMDVPAQGYAHPRWSPDGSRLAVAITKSGRTDIWIMNGATRTFSRLTSDGLSDTPAWAPDGTSIAYRHVGADSTVIAMQRVDGSDSPHTIIASTRMPYSVRFSPDGRWIIYRTTDYGSLATRVYAISRAHPDSVMSLSTAISLDFSPEPSPDGKWVATTSLSTGRPEVLVLPFTEQGARYAISSDGGNEPRWSKDGRTLYYRLGRAMWAASITTSPSFAVTNRHKLFDGQFLADPSQVNYDVMPDGKSFLMIQPADSQTETLLIWGWGNELRKLWGK